MFLSYEHLTMRYEPFPIGLAKPVMDRACYEELVASYPPLELFEHLPKVGNKYSLSEKNNADEYRAHLKAHPCWQAFHDWVKTVDCIQDALDALAAHGVDLGLEVRPQRLRNLVRNVKKGRYHAGQRPLVARFEFSMLPADGGSVIPHTDAPGKIITLVVSMVKEGEWDPAFGGGTDVNRPKDPRLYYNERNRQGTFEQMEILDTFPFEPNQAVVFVKTFNSWHSVRPMTGRGTGAMRRTLTINIEAPN
jgi:hypothetical protein